MATHFSGTPESTGPNKLLIIIPCAILGVLLAVYLGGVVFFYNMFMPGTTLDGQDVSLRSAADVAAEKGDALAGYQTHVTGDGVDLEITSNQIDLAYDGNAYASSAIAETNPWTWPAAIANDRSISVESTVVFDRDALLALFEPFKKESAESVASLGGKVVSFDAERGVFGLDPSITAQYLNDDAIVDALTAGFVAQQPTIELGVEQLSDTDDELHATADAANALLGAAGSTSGGLDIRPFPTNWKMQNQLGEFASNKKRWDEHTVINLIPSLKDGDLAIIIDCGVDDFFLEVNRRAHQSLLDHNIKHDYIERPGAHNNAYWNNSIDYQLLFFHKFFAQPKESKK